MCICPHTFKDHPLLPNIGKPTFTHSLKAGVEKLTYTATGFIVIPPDAVPQAPKPLSSRPSKYRCICPHTFKDPQKPPNTFKTTFTYNLKKARTGTRAGGPGANTFSVAKVREISLCRSKLLAEARNFTEPAWRMRKWSPQGRSKATLSPRVCRLRLRLLAKVPRGDY